MLPFLVRPLKAKADSQSSEHGVVATGKHVDLSGCLFIKGHVLLLRDPEVMQQDRQLPGYSDHCLVSGLLASSGSQV
jgi:hypothetical protein